MTAIYLVDVVGDGLSPATAYRFPPVLQNDQTWRLLMIDSVRRKNGQVKNAAQKKGLIVHPSNSLATTGIVRVEFAATAVALIAKMKTTAVAGAMRTALRGYADANGYTRFREDTVWNALVDLLAEVEPAMNLEATILTVG